MREIYVNCKASNKIARGSRRIATFRGVFSTVLLPRYCESRHCAEFVNNLLAQIPLTTDAIRFYQLLGLSSGENFVALSIILASKLQRTTNLILSILNRRGDTDTSKSHAKPLYFLKRSFCREKSTRLTNYINRHVRTLSFLFDTIFSLYNS